MTTAKFGRQTFLFFLMAATLMSSCLVSSRSDIEVFNQNKYSDNISVRTVRVPLFITKPVIKKYLRYAEDVPREITDLAGTFKKIRVTIAETANDNLVEDFRQAVLQSPGEEWLTLRNGKQWVLIKANQNSQDMIRDLSVAVSAPDENQLVYVKMKCKLTPDQLSTLINFAINHDEGKRFLK